MDDDFQNSGAYQYFFGEAVEITKRIEEYRREHGRIDDYPVPVCTEHSSENISHMINYQRQNQPSMSIPFNPVSLEHHYPQDNSHMIYHHQLQNQPTVFNTPRRPCLRCLLSMKISWFLGLFTSRQSWRPIHTPMPFHTLPHSISEQFGHGPSQHSVDETLQRIQERERVNIGGGEPVNAGRGLTAIQISQLPTIRFQPSIEDKKCMICQSDYARGDKMTILPCTHKYHEECIRPWLQNNKLCCVCQREVVV